MKAMDFCTGWYVRHVDESGLGKPVSVPDDAMLREERKADAVGGLNVSWFEGRDYLYTRKLQYQSDEPYEALSITVNAAWTYPGNNEVLTISHQAQSRTLFAVGAINAAVFLADKGAGSYDMSDLLKERY